MMTLAELNDHLLLRLREVQERLGGGEATAQTPFAEAVDSMGLVEFVGVVAADCSVKPDEIEQAVRRRFSTVADLAKAMHARRLVPREARGTQGTFAFAQHAESAPAQVWLTRWQTVRPELDEPAAETDQALGVEAGWLERHAGIRSRWDWFDEEPLPLVAAAARVCLEGTRPRDLAALLVTSEAPPEGANLGWGALMHHLIGLPSRVPALEVGGACLGFLHALWLGSRLVHPGDSALIVAVESPTHLLGVVPGPSGEMAALFGDGAGVCLLRSETAPGSLPLRDLLLGCDGSEVSLIQVEWEKDGVSVRMDGPALALRAVDQLAAVVRQVCERNEVELADLEAVHVHAGNGRMPPLVARKLNLPEDRVISTTPFSGNLGSVSLLAALSHRPPRGDGPVVLAAVGAGLNWGAALFDARLSE